MVSAPRAAGGDGTPMRDRKHEARRTAAPGRHRISGESPRARPDAVVAAL